MRARGAFIDGSHFGHAVLSIRSARVRVRRAAMLAEVGGVAMNAEGRGLVRDFFGLERVVSFVADLFPWEQVETIAASSLLCRVSPSGFYPRTGLRVEISLTTSRCASRLRTERTRKWPSGKRSPWRPTPNDRCL